MTAAIMLTFSGGPRELWRGGAASGLTTGQ